MPDTSPFLTMGLAFLLSTGCAGHLVYASAPYRGVVIDAETKQPIAGAVVLAVWFREAPAAPHGPAVDYHDALEALTDEHGEFAVPERTHMTLFGSIREPDFVVFAPGYAFYPSLDAWPQGNEVDLAYARRIFRVELSRLQTPEERVKLGSPSIWVSKVPEPSMPNLVRLVNQERHALGLPAIHLGR
jgi:hypothetical protein